MKTKKQNRPTTPLAKKLVSDFYRPEDAPECVAARRELDAAYPGMYREATRPLREIEAELSTAEGERKTVLEHARRLCFFGPHSRDTLKALANAKTFKEREQIRAEEQRAAEERERQRLEDIKAATARALAARKTEEAKAAEKERDRAERERQAQDDFRTLAEGARAKVTANTKRARVNRRNGKLGGAPTKDSPEAIKEAVEGVRERLKNNPYSLSMKRVCEHVREEKKLLIQWESLRNYVNKAQKGK